VSTEPQWLRLARDDLDVNELPGKATSPVIRRWLIELKAWWEDDATPWCGVAVAAWMRSCGLMLPKHWYRAKGWLDWGLALDEPVVGCVVVYERKGGGHVGFVVGRDANGNILTLGGNQGDKVSIAAFDPKRVAGYRWPLERLVSLHEYPALPLLASNAPVSTNEA
jgi:uncharacterized protein (TIGR02594 family)